MHVGQVLTDHVYDENGILLLAAGSRVTEKFLHRTRFRDIRMGQPAKHKPASEPRKSASQIVRAVPAPPPTLELETATTVQLDQLVEDVGVLLPPVHTPTAPIPCVELSRLRDMVETSSSFRQDAVEQYANVATDVQRGKSLHLGASGVLLNQLLASIQRDQSLAMLLMDMEDAGEDYLFQHGMNVSLLSMRVAAHLGFDRETVMEAGMAALFQDIGMLSVPRAIRMAPRALTAAEKQEIQRHPIYTVERLARSNTLRPVGLLIAYQAHERCDESGYPRHRAGDAIHPLAQVVAAADTYCALTGQRAHRESLSPFAAMATLLNEVRLGRLERDVVRSFLQCVSLFPVGSYVRIGESQNARVLRANPGRLDKPTVVPLNSDGTETDEELNLARPGSPSITAALHRDDLF